MKAKCYLQLTFIVSNELLMSFYFSFSCMFSGDGGITHSLSWHRKGERVTGCKLYARVWTPEDPRANQKNHTTKYPHATEQTRI